MRIIDRLDKYMDNRGINDNQVTVNCGLSVGLLGKARQGKSDIGKKSIEKILIFYQDLNRVWLLTGEGDMLKSVNPEVKVTSTTNNISPTDERSILIKSISEMTETAKTNSTSIEKMVETADRNSRTLERLVDLLYQNGVIVSDETQKGGDSSRKNPNEDKTNNDERFKAG